MRRFDWIIDVLVPVFFTVVVVCASIWLIKITLKMVLMGWC